MKLKLYQILYLEGEFTILEQDEGIALGTLGNLVHEPSPDRRLQWYWRTTVRLVGSDVQDGAYPAHAGYRVGDPVRISGIHDLAFNYDRDKHRKRGHSVLLQNPRWSILFQEMDQV